MQVVGNLDPVTGLPIPYLEPTVSIPPGVKVTSYPGTQAIFGANGTGTGALFECSGPGTQAQPTRIWNLWFAGGDPAISLDNSGAGEKWGHILNCRFMGSKVGVSAAASDGFSLHVQVTSCELTPGPPASAFAPGYSVVTSPPEIGLKFHAARQISSPDAHVYAQVYSLDMVGDFTSTGDRSWPQPTRSLDSLQQEVGDVSRAIQVSATAEEGTVQPPTTSVELLVSGCTLDGGGTATSDPPDGWDIGILAYSEAPTVPQTPDGIACSFDVTVLGSSIERFKYAGVVAVGSAYSSGTMTLQGQTAVRHNGLASLYSPPGFLGSGVYGCAYEGYLGLFAEKCTVSDNAGHGVMVESRANNISGYDGDLGAFVGLEQSKIHGNGGDGVSLYSSWEWDEANDEWDVANASRAVVGGTSRADPTLGITLAGTVDATLPGTGPGYIRRCAISNNGGRGIFATAAGSSTPSPPGLGIKAVSLAIVNCVIWNHPLGGFLLLGDTGPGAFPNYLGPHLLAPLVHCTLAGNGSTAVDPWTGQQADYSVEVFEATNSTQLDNRYRWDDPSGVMLSTRINNDILQRANPNDPDLGPMLNGSHGIAENVVPPSVHDRVPVGAIRAAFAGLPNITGIPLLHADFAPWNAITLTSRDETQFVLLNSGPGGRFSQSLTYLHAAASDSVIDFFGTVRDVLTSGTREKGYDEFYDGQ